MSLEESVGALSSALAQVVERLDALSDVLASVLSQVVERLDALNDMLAAVVTGPAATGVSLGALPPAWNNDSAQDQGAQAPAAATPGAREADSPAASAPRPPAPTPAPAAPAPAAAAALRYDIDIGPRLVKIAQTKGRPELVAFISAFGVSKGADIPLERYPEVVAKADALLVAGA